MVAVVMKSSTSLKGTEHVNGLPLASTQKRGRRITVALAFVVVLGVFAIQRCIVQYQFGSFQIRSRHVDATLVRTQQQHGVMSFDELEIMELKGQGTISLGFTAKVKEQRHGYNETYMAKMSYRDRHMSKAELEIKLFGILNAPPVSPNIPELIMAISRMKNPFRSRRYNERVLDLNSDTARALSKTKEIAVLVVELLDTKNRRPKRMKDLRVYLRSLLQGLEFAHSRGVINGDLHKHNVLFDGQTAKLFDWNEGFVFEPNAVPMYYPGVEVKMPPEGWTRSVLNETAVHATVSSFDIWSAGLLIQELVQVNRLHDSNNYFETTSYPLLMDMKESMLTKDPYKRPNATKLLQHQFFQDTNALGR